MPPRQSKRKLEKDRPREKVVRMKAEVSKPREWAASVRDEMRDSLLPPIIEMILPYCRSDRWLFISPSKRRADGKGSRLVVYDTEQGRITMDRPTLVHTSTYEEKGHYTQMIIPYRNALYYVESPSVHAGLFEMQRKKTNFGFLSRQVSVGAVVWIRTATKEESIDLEILVYWNTM
jgi:hypothetical protein